MDKWTYCVVLCAILVLAACGGGPIRTRVPDADFSRGVLIARGISGRFAAWMQDEELHFLAPQGKRLIHLQLPLREPAELGRFPLEPQDVSLPVGSGILPQAFPLPGTNETLVTVVAQTEAGAQLVVGRLGPEGWRSALEPLSPLGQPVRTYRAALDSSGALWAVWAPKQEPTLWARWWPRGEGAPLDVQALRWTVAPLPQGGVGLLWVSPEGELNFAVVRPGGVLTSAVRLAAGLTSGGGRVDELVAVAPGAQMFVAWETRFVGGLQAGTSSVWILAFPWDDPTAAHPLRLALPMAERPAYKPLFGGPPGWSRWASLAAPGHGSDFVADPWLTALDTEAVLLAVSAFRWQRLDRVAQIAVVLSTPRGMGYQAAARTPGFSHSPQILVGEQGQWLLWREGAAGEQVYLSTTDPRWRETLNRPTWGDVGEGILQGTVEALTGAALFPLAVFWLLPGALVLLGGALLHVGDLTTSSGRIVFGVAFGVYQLAKALFLPGLFEYAPFSAWFDLPPGVAQGLRYGVPLGIPVLGLGIGGMVLHRHRSASVPLGYVLSAGVDALVTLMLYGVNFLGAWA